ncbi:MFS transporter [Sphingomonas sp.]|uniref:MFS transporter n=1 Tax=Sphingomonas sp. TaxID=28214 RepID=UPI001B25D4ED|nr:MFS transporter [Sphingomonas sp.]MBO9711637.1 MFS transporter [Sphingomonas sp.]
MAETATMEFRNGWRSLAGSMLGLAIGVHALPFGTSGLFLGPLTRTFGWTRAEASFGPTLLFLCLGAIAPIFGTVIDRFGARRVILPGLLALTLFFVALSQTTGSLAFYYGTFIAVGVIGVGSATPTYTRIVNARFRAARGRALGIALIGTGLSSAAMPPLLSLAIDAWGWRAGYFLLAGVVALATPVVLALLKAEDGAKAAKADDAQVPFPTILRDPLLWGLGLIFFLVALAVGGFSGHFVAMMTDRGFSAVDAARMMGAGGLFLIAGRLVTGFLIDRFFAPRVAAVIMVVSAAGFLLIAQSGPGVAVVGLVVAGLAFGAEIDLVSYLVARYFGLAAYGRTYGILYAFVVVGTAISPTAYGWCFDRFGSYVEVLHGAGILLGAAAAGFLLLRRFPVLDGSASSKSSIVGGEVHA